MKLYTGVGSRDTNPEMLDLIQNVASVLGKQGWVLRSGGADGADSAFEAGCDAVQGSKKIYIPWDGFNGRHQDGQSVLTLDQGDRDGAMDLVKEVHPAYGMLSRGALALHARNAYQVLGLCLDAPSKFLLCYAPSDKYGVPKGGTRTAWMLAQMFDIPCFNLGNERDYERMISLLENK
jgi:hypothetical protein